MSIGSTELLLVLIAILLLFGGRRLPEIARNFGQGLAGFRRAIHDIQQDLQNPLATSDPIHRTSDARSQPLTETPQKEDAQDAAQSRTSQESSRSDS